MEAKLFSTSLLLAIVIRFIFTMLLIELVETFSELNHWSRIFQNTRNSVQMCADVFADSEKKWVSSGI